MYYTVWVPIVKTNLNIKNYTCSRATVPYLTQIVYVTSIIVYSMSKMWNFAKFYENTPYVRKCNEIENTMYRFGHESNYSSTIILKWQYPVIRNGAKAHKMTQVLQIAQ